jgi:iron(III) transport system substrate-binding protein
MPNPSAFLRPVFLRHVTCVALIAFAGVIAGRSTASAEGEVNIYSYREPGLINPLLAAFSKKTGIKTNVVFATSGLIERLAAEGKNSPADLLLTNESGLLLQAVAAGVTQPLRSAALEGAIPAQLRDPDGHWFGLTQRARVVYASKDRVKQDTITYEELADPKWRNKICIRSGQHTYNVALVASMIAHHGAEETEKWLTGLKANLARRPAGGDREAVRDVQAGLCDLAVGNTTTWRRCSRTRTRRPGPTLCASSSPTPATAERTSTSPASRSRPTRPTRTTASV